MRAPSLRLPVASLSFALGLALAGCDSEPTSPSTDAGADARADVTSDTVTDTGSTAPQDSEVDSGREAGADATQDAGAEVGADAATDVAWDSTAPLDVTADALSDAPSGDAAVDAGADGGDSGTGAWSRCGLLRNPGAESGTLEGWTRGVGDFSAVGYEADRYPRPYEGSFQFAGGTGAEARLTQDVDVSALASRIDTGGYAARLGGYLRDWANDDEAWLELEARDASGARLGSARGLSDAGEVWTPRSATVRLPAGTRSLRATLVSLRHSGSDNDGYFDALDLCVTTELPSVDESLLVGPWLTGLTGDAVTVAWETRAPTTGRVLFGATSSLGRTVDATASGTVSHARLTGLAPGATAYYRLEVGGVPGALHSFRTAPSDGAFSFVVWGDNQNGPTRFGPLVTAMARRSPAFALAVGDQVQTSTDDNFRNQLLAPLAPLAPTTPLLLAPGNHDHDGDPTHARFLRYVPQPGTCFVWRYGRVGFLFLDSEHALPGGITESCLTQAAASTEFTSADFRVALFHQPPRVEYWAGGGVTGNTWVRNTLEPRLAALRVNLALNGHAHMYTWGPAGTSGITWVTTGGGGGALEGPGDRVQDWPEITQVFFRHHYLYVTVEGETMNVQAIADTGEALHTFTLRR